MKLGNQFDEEMRKARAERDVMSAANLGLVKDVLDTFDKAGKWDAPPMLLMAAREMFDGEDGDGDSMAFALMPAPFRVPDGGGPAIAAMLHAMAHQLRELAVAEESVPASWYAWLLVFEAWAVGVPIDDEAAARNVERAADAHELHKHPERVETRQVLMVDRAGALLMATAERVSGERTAMVAKARERPVGLLVDALVDLLDASLEMLASS